MEDEATIFDELDVPEVINAAGTKTRVGGTRLRPEAADAMRAASNSFVRISNLQARASQLIADVTHADAGYVVTGASAALTVAAAACIAGDDYGVMNRLPNTSDVPEEIIMARSHRNGYDHALRLAGATIVDVGTSDRTLGTASTNVELWEYEDAISDETAAIAYTARPTTEPPLPAVTELAHEHDLPVVVDAAAELPPAENLSRFVDEGADLVAFSGGKAIRGPQATGILAGRQDLIRSVALQQLDMDIVDGLWDPPSEFFEGSSPEGVPRHGVGRGMKVGREELVGLIRALETFVDENDTEIMAEWQDRAIEMADRLAELSDVSVEVTGTEDPTAISSTVIEVTNSAADLEAGELVRSLQNNDPSIYVGYAGGESDELTLNPMCLTDEEAKYVSERVISIVETT